jgi:putative hydrolase of the HAD superfamily
VADACEALILDFGGVISKTLFETHRANEAALGLPEFTLDWYGPFGRDSDALWRAMEAGEISERDYYFRRTAETGALLGETWTALPDLLRRIRGDDPASAIRPEALDAISRAKAAGRKLAVLSNELDLFYGADFRARLDFLRDFDVIVDATYTKVLKPAPEAYAFATEGLGLPAAACVFVDDQWRNVQGGLAAGLRCVHFDVTQPQTSYHQALTMLGL